MFFKKILVGLTPTGDTVYLLLISCDVNVTFLQSLCYYSHKRLELFCDVNRLFSAKTLLFFSIPTEKTKKFFLIKFCTILPIYVTNPFISTFIAIKNVTKTSRIFLLTIATPLVAVRISVM